MNPFSYLLDPISLLGSILITSTVLLIWDWFSNHSRRKKAKAELEEVRGMLSECFPRGRLSRSKPVTAHLTVDQFEWVQRRAKDTGYKDVADFVREAIGLRLFSHKVGVPINPLTPVVKAQRRVKKGKAPENKTDPVVLGEPVPQVETTRKPRAKSEPHRIVPDGELAAERSTKA